MNRPSRNKTLQRIVKNVLSSSLPIGMKTSWWLLKLTIPVSLGVFLLDHFGILNSIAHFTEPFFRMIGLSGKASVLLITSYFTNIYSVIAIMATMDIGIREALIIANMSLIAHALVVETGIQKKTGSSALRMVFLRLVASFLVAWILNLILPGMEGKMNNNMAGLDGSFNEEFIAWLEAIAITSIKIVLMVNLLLIFQMFLRELGILKWLVKPFHPILKLSGLPESTGFLWLVAYTLGLSYGGAIMISQSNEGHLTRDDADLLNHHIAVSHSLLEDTLLFAAIGLSIPWMIFPRYILAVMATWGRRLELKASSRYSNHTLY